MKYSFLALLMLFTVTWTYAQEQTYSFSLEEAIAFALENNYSAINADRDLLDAKKQKWETIATGLPQIDGAVSYQNQLKQPVSLLPGELAGQEPGTFIPVVFGQPKLPMPRRPLNNKFLTGHTSLAFKRQKPLLPIVITTRRKLNWRCVNLLLRLMGMFFCRRKALPFWKKNKVNLKKSFRNPKLFENGLGDEESVEQLQITLSSIDNQLKNSLRLQSITLQMLNINYGSGHRCSYPIKGKTIRFGPSSDTFRSLGRRFHTRQQHRF